MINPSETIRLAGWNRESIVDGPGIRAVFFTQGCPHHCPGCHNPCTHSFNGGTIVRLDGLVSYLKNAPWLDGLTLSGGEPFCQPEECRVLAQAAHEAGLNVWCYTGYRFEELIELPGAQALLAEVDVLVDGPFELEKRTLELPWRGSSNQRLIDVKKSLEEGAAVLYACE